jgi:putative Ca2+/H+ antiporter (TMEM165/GDT1 family)
MTTFLASLAFVVLSEMGDKTQLLAMAFASRYPWKTVLWGVFVATLANHFLAVLVGDYLTVLVPLDAIKLAAAASFILFGLWTLRGDRLGDEDRRFNFSPFWTVTAGMFLAEMGDKTQLATIVLAARYESVLSVWLGTTTGMVIADAIGIIVGVVLGKNIPERLVKGFAATVFIAFGILGFYDALPKDFWTWQVTVTGAALLILAAFIAIRGERP